MKSQKGTSVIFIVVIAVLILAVGIYVYIMKSGVPKQDEVGLLESTESTDSVVESAVSEFEALEASESAPEEISDEVVDELDALMNEVESTADEDLSGLDL